MDIERGHAPLPAIRVLMEETDPRLRAEAHLLLGKRAVARDDAIAAEAHFQEAAELDPADEDTWALLRRVRRHMKPGSASFWHFLRR